MPGTNLRFFAFFASALAALAADATSATPSPPPVEVLYRFSGGADGGNPHGPLVEDSAGNLYGTAEYGGDAGVGVVFRLSLSKTGKWKEAVLHSFGGAGDGAYPAPGLAQDSQGNFFGATFSGGSGGGGVVFELSPGTHGTWNYSVLFGFGSADSGGGSNPSGSLALDPGGNLYGTTQLGGMVTCTNFPGPCGVVFELSPARGGGWTENVLYSFRGPPDGSFPYASPILDGSGNLYGATSEGGKGKCNDGEGTVIGCGTVFELAPSKNGWSESLLYQFSATEQNAPGSPLVFGADGSLYGVAGYDVFRLKHGARGWKKTTIHEFTEGIAGTIPSSGAVFDSAGDLYGTTTSSGLDGFSTVYELLPRQGGAWKRVTLARLGKGFDSDQPRGGVLIAADGAIYGAASGTSAKGYVFRVAR
jgi:uncharacterized repeat protein (TIGR03803 family)